MRIQWAALIVWLLVSGSVFAETIELENGDKIEGAILEKNDQVWIVEHPVLGRLEIPVDEIKPPEEEKVKPGVFGTSFLKGWDKALSAGFNGSSGKSRDANINIDASLQRETERNRMDWVARYYFSSTDKSTSDNQFDTRYAHDFLVPDAKWFPFASPHYRYDAEQNWNHRFGIDVGVGYEILKTERWDVVGRLGGGFAQTLTDDRDDTSVGEDPVRSEWLGLVGLRLGWAMMKGMSVSWDTWYQPAFNDLPNFRLESRAEWKVAIGYVEGLSFKLGGSYIYDAHETDTTRNDRKYYGNLVYDF